jgi:hypothetical protein
MNANFSVSRDDPRGLGTLFIFVNGTPAEHSAIEHPEAGHKASFRRLERGVHPPPGTIRKIRVIRDQVFGPGLRGSRRTN